MRKARRFTADFETTTDINDCRVWSWAVFEIGRKDAFEWGTDIASFIEFCSKPKENYTIAFHNLKFDCQFILSFLLNNQFEWRDNKKNCEDKTFTTLITDTGQFFSIEVFFVKGKGKRTNKVKFIDSLKVLNFSVDEIAKSFGLPIQKLDLDYTKYREVGYNPTDDELSYIRNDVEIMAMALDILYSNGHTKMTSASNAWESYKEMMPFWRRYFPELDKKCDADIRSAYKGGFTYVNPVSAEKEWGEGVVYDVNSLYPSILRNKLMPSGKPVPFEGKYQYDATMPLYVQKINCKFRIKEGKIPSIQIKNTTSFMPNQYLEEGNWDKEEGVTLTLCSVDLQLFFEQYHVKEITYLGGWKMQARFGLFDKYVDYWMKEKVESKKKGLKAQTSLAKLQLNSLYGRMGINPKCGIKVPYLDDEGVVRYERREAEDKKTIYVPVAVFTTAYGRDIAIRTSQAIRDWSLAKYGEDLYRYTDTDSAHICIKNKNDIEELKKIIEIDDYKLGAWKLESTFVRGKWLRQKCYIEQAEDGTINSTIAGLPKKLNHLINFDNFKIGFTTEDFTAEEMGDNAKLAYTYCKGGVVLTPTDFTIK